MLSKRNIQCCRQQLPPLVRLKALVGFKDPYLLCEFSSGYCHLVYLPKIKINHCNYGKLTAN